MSTLSWGDPIKGNFFCDFHTSLISPFDRCELVD